MRSPVRLLALSVGASALLALATPSATLADDPARPGDFNGDGYTDLAIGAPDDDNGAGSVTVLLGSRLGISAAGSQRWSQASPGVKGEPSSGDYSDFFGTSLASADFDGDGFADLAIEVLFDEINGESQAGAVSVLYGMRRGLSADRDQRWSRANLPGDYGPNSLAAGDLDGDGFADLAFGLVHDDGSRFRVQVLYGGAEGLSTARTARLSREDSGATGMGANIFGAALAVGDLDGDGFADLAVGSPAEYCDDDHCIDDRGEVAVFYGGPDGVDPVGEHWNQNSAGMLDVDEFNDLFGTSLAIGDFDADGFGDLAVGVVGETVTAVEDFEDRHEGAVAILRGSADGVVAEGNQLWHQDVSGIPGRAGPDHGFGIGLSTGDLDGDGHDDLAIGAAGDKVAGEGWAGSVTVMYGADEGLSATRAQRWTQATAGVPGVAGAIDFFGSSTAIGNFGRTQRADLAIGAHGDPVDGVRGAGSVTVLYGRVEGIATRGAQRWTQATPGVVGSPERFGFFGRALAP